MTVNIFKLSFVPFRYGHMMTVTVSPKYTYAGSPLIKHQLEGVKIPDVSVLLCSLHLQARAFGLTENDSVALGPKIEGTA